MNKTLCTEPAVNIEALIPSTTENLETLELPRELSEEVNALLFSEDEGDGYFNGCDLAFPFEPLRIEDLDDFADWLTDDPEDATSQEKKWWDKINEKLSGIDWKEVEDNINVAVFGLGQIIGYLIRVIAKVIFSVIFVFALGEMAPELRQQIPSLYNIVDVLMNFSENFLRTGLAFIYRFF